jgi:threonyl-tRNA synthetase
VIIPITDAVLDYSKNVIEKLKETNLRVELDNSGQSMQKRIRNAEMQKIPYIVILGEKELKENKLAVRQRGRIDLGVQTPEEFIARLKSEIEEKR